MISEKIYTRIAKMSDRVKNLDVEEVNEQVEKGKALIEKYGEDDLQYRLKPEEQEAAGTFFLYRVAIDESNYE